jgi:hypothetical protein
LRAAELDYETVSYCWGNAEDYSTTTVDVEGFAVRVTKNALQVLLRFRLPDGERKIWIDSICINQADAAERSSQVADMHIIYKNGQQNLIWLGDDDGTLDKVSYAINALVEEIKQETDDYLTYHDTVYVKPKCGATAPRGFTRDVDWEVLVRFFTRPWFHRLWVVQEATLASLNSCYCGSHEFSFIEILRVANWLVYKGHFLPDGLGSPNWIAGPGWIANIADTEVGLCHDALRRGQTIGISAMLYALKNMNCHDPRDHVYGVLGLYKHFSGSSTLPSLLQADYRRPLADILQDATRYTMIEQGTLYALNYVSHRLEGDKDSLILPSWTVRWHEKSPNNLEPRIIGLTCRANGDTKYVPVKTSLSDCDVLALRGFFVDGLEGAQVKSISTLCSSNEGVKQLFDYASSASTTQQISCVYTDVQAAMAMTLVAGQDITRGSVTSDIVANYEAFCACRNKTRKLPEWVSDTESENEDIRRARRFMQVIANPCWRRKLFITASGRVGLGPQTMVIGDVAVIMFGGRTPFILRPLREEYELVGQCYIHGIMNGEAMDAHQESEDEDVIFRIR